ncbi:MAG TPA: protein-export chaperone SecB [Gammaproteobacteria bacterium]|nr:protein-export chaperone SecB [Gammaproteobacteria bacterium]
MATEQNTAAKPDFSIQRIYTKDLSLESPKTPQLFSEQWTPEVKMELNTEAKPISDDLYEVSIKITVTVHNKDIVAFLIEVVQAGLFMLKDFAPAQRNQMLGSFCPNILYPYAREVISSLAANGGFPALYLSPINFEALYAQHLNKLKASEDAKATAAQEIIV